MRRDGIIMWRKGMESVMWFVIVCWIGVRILMRWWYCFEDRWMSVWRNVCVRRSVSMNGNGSV